MTTLGEFTSALTRSYEIAARENVSTLINCQSRKAFTSRELFPPGGVRAIEPGVTAYAH